MPCDGFEERANKLYQRLSTSIFSNQAWCLFAGALKDSCTPFIVIYNKPCSFCSISAGSIKNNVSNYSFCKVLKLRAEQR